jgi:hypothetical protein
VVCGWDVAVRASGTHRSWGLSAVSYGQNQTPALVMPVAHCPGIIQRGVQSVDWTLDMLEVLKSGCIFYFPTLPLLSLWLGPVIRTRLPTHQT